MFSERASQIIDFLKNLQSDICKGLEDADEKSKFRSDLWEREEGGGGLSRIIEDGNIFEKGGVNFSAVDGNIPGFLAAEIKHLFPDLPESKKFLATGVSIVIHPESPLIPIIHMNIRYFETDSGAFWFGGGIDLTPIYVEEIPGKEFHQSLKTVCDKFDPEYYPKFKDWADEYFYIKHRKETRGIGGIFFDKLIPDDKHSFENIFEFWKNVGETFLPTYLNQINKHKNESYTDEQKTWQLIRRGRYVEFNLVYDKGTKFGLETNGRIESILMSLPKFASWQYDFKTTENSKEEETLRNLKIKRSWAS